MRKIVCGMIVLILLFTSSCFSRSKGQVYDEGYEDIEQQIIDKYGEFLTVRVTDNGDMILSLKDSYPPDDKIHSKVPEYVIVEEVRLMVNNYIAANPDSILSNDAKNKCLSITLYVQLGSHAEDLFVIDNWHNNYGNGDMKCEQHFGTYWKIDLSTIRNRINESYISDMYDYIAQSGDVSYIQIVYPGVLDEKEEKDWKEDIMDKFPMMKEYVEHD